MVNGVVGGMTVEDGVVVAFTVDFCEILDDAQFFPEGEDLDEDDMENDGERALDASRKFFTLTRNEDGTWTVE